MFGLDPSSSTILLLDGMTSGAIYCLIAIALVLVFAVTRIIFVPQGEFVVYGALTLAMLQQGTTPGTVWLLLFLAACATITELIDLVRSGQPSRIPRAVLQNFVAPALIAGLVWWAAPQQFPLAVQVVLTLLLVTAIGAPLYTMVYESMADASVLMLLIASVGVHLVLNGLGLMFFGAEGFRSPALWEERWSLGAITISGQTMVVALVAIALLVGLWLLSERTLYGKALRATAVNRMGARLMGVSTSLVGKLTFSMAAFIGALSGVLIGPLFTMFYDSGFIIALKGFVAATIGGFASYAGAAIGALFVGSLESFSSFWASDFKEVIVFMALLPVLLWRSILWASGGSHDEEEE
jgi:branched-chain amino acid transport system permease protein